MRRFGLFGALRGCGPASNAVYGVVVACFGGLTLVSGVLWAGEDAPAPAPVPRASEWGDVRDAAPPTASAAETLCKAGALCTGILLLSWAVTATYGPDARARRRSRVASG